MSLIANLQKSVPTDDCRLWTGGRSSAGYGLVGFEGSARYAHGLAYELHHPMELMPAGLVHSCGEKLCTNPAHLAPTETRTPIEERDKLVRLPDAAVYAIYYDPRKQKDIAAEYAIRPVMVRRIKHRKAWKHIVIESLPDEGRQ